MAKAGSAGWSENTDREVTSLISIEGDCQFMERTLVTSSNIRAAGYDPDTQTLEVEFNGGSVYQYSGVPPNEYDGLMNAGSKGSYFHANIRNRYSYVRL